MRYAAISDIHGNMPALQAVLDDCKKQNIDKFLFLGDYYGDFPTLNEVISSVKRIHTSYAIKGNKEARMVEFKNTDSYEWTSEQLAPLFWSLRNISDESYSFINQLPETFSFSYGNINFYLAHSPRQHFGYGITDNFTAQTFFEQMGKNYSNHEEYLKFIKNNLQSDSDFMNKISVMPDGIYLYGHYHTQWYANIKGKLLINPGSCGLPLDFDNTAPYSIIDTNNNGTVIERRVRYDTSKSLQLLKESTFYDIAPFWNELIIEEFTNSRVAVLLFLEFIEKLAIDKNEKTHPYSNELWREAIAKYNEIGRTRQGAKE